MTEDERRLPHADLRESLDGLAALAVDQLGLHDLLIGVATQAARAIPGAEGVGVTLFDEANTHTIVASEAFVREVDDIQYGIGEGPCITAAAERRTVRSGALGQEPLWPRFGAAASTIGVHSALSLPLLTGGEVIGAMNVYARAHDAFDEESAAVGELFAVPAAISMHNARALQRARVLADQLRAALASRPVIDQAIGILMSRTGATSDEAFDRLRALSQAENLRVALIAQNIVDEAVRRARARRPDDPARG